MWCGVVWCYFLACLTVLSTVNGADVAGWGPRDLHVKHMSLLVG